MVDSNDYAKRVCNTIEALDLFRYHEGKEEHASKALYYLLIIVIEMCEATGRLSGVRGSQNALKDLEKYYCEHNAPDDAKKAVKTAQEMLCKLHDYEAGQTELAITTCTGIFGGQQGN